MHFVMGKCNSDLASCMACMALKLTINGHRIKFIRDDRANSPRPGFSSAFMQPIYGAEIKNDVFVDVSLIKY